MERYFRTIDTYADGEIDALISNGELSNMHYVLKLFFRHAKETIYIFSREANIHFFLNNEWSKEALTFLKRRSAKLIIASSFQDAHKKEFNNSFLSSILSNNGENGIVEVWDSSHALKDKINDFILMDNKAYILIADNDVGKAVANFGDKKTADRLFKIYKAILENSTRTL